MKLFNGVNLSDKSKVNLLLGAKTHRRNYINNADYNELKTILKALAFEIKKKELLALMREYDLDNEGRINFTDYTSLSNQFQLESISSYC